MSNPDRITKIVNRAARRCGVQASVLASYKSFDVFCEKWRRKQDGTREYLGCLWIKRKMEDVYCSPSALARSIVAEMRDVWA